MFFTKTFLVGTSGTLSIKIIPLGWKLGLKIEGGGRSFVNLDSRRTTEFSSRADETPKECMSVQELCHLFKTCILLAKNVFH